MLVELWVIISVAIVSTSAQIRYAEGFVLYLIHGKESAGAYEDA